MQNSYRGEETRLSVGQQTEESMLYWALVFLVIAIIAGFLGFGGVAFAAAEVAKILFFLFLVIFVVMLLTGLTGGGEARQSSVHSRSRIAGRARSTGPSSF
jgi:uncharacterized membrane protein YtjA (UPF0391 family)